MYRWFCLIFLLKIEYFCVVTNILHTISKFLDVIVESFLIMNNVSQVVDVFQKHTILNDNFNHSRKKKSDVNLKTHDCHENKKNFKCFMRSSFRQSSFYINTMTFFDFFCWKSLKSFWRSFYRRNKLFCTLERRWASIVTIIEYKWFTFFWYELNFIKKFKFDFFAAFCMID